MVKMEKSVVLIIVVSAVAAILFTKLEAMVFFKAPKKAPGGAGAKSVEVRLRELEIKVQTLIELLSKHINLSKSEQQHMGKSCERKGSGKESKKKNKDKIDWK
jgi:hypothetical protein